MGSGPHVSELHTSADDTIVVLIKTHLCDEWRGHTHENTVDDTDSTDNSMLAERRGSKLRI